MSIGEKILQARKNAGLSQEQLAQQMGIEWETLSRWEDETELPDEQQTELLEQLLAARLGEEPPLEEISYVHKSEELGQLGKEWSGFASIYTRIILIVLALVTALCPFASLAFDLSLGLLIGAALGFLMGKTLSKKRWKKLRSAYEGVEYSLRIFPDRFEQICRKEGEETINRVEFGKVNLAKTGALYTILETERMRYSIPNSALAESVVLSRVAEDGRKSLRREMKLYAFYVSLFLLSLTAVAIMFDSFFEYLGGPNGTIYGIVALALTILPIATILVCLRLKKGTATKVLGTVFSVGFIIALMIFGGLSLVISSVRSGADETLTQLEELTDISVPQYATVNKEYYKAKEYEGQNMCPQRSWEFSFDGYMASLLELQVEESKIWRESSNPTLDTIFGSFMLVEGWDYLVIYEPETGRVNRRPDADGTYCYVVASYDRDEGVLLVVSYELYFKK